MKFLICVGFFLFVEMCFAQQTFDKLNVKTLNSNKVVVTSTTDSSKPCPAMTEAQRDAIGSPATGSCVYNTTSLQLNVYNGTIWKAAGGGISDWETGFNYAIGDVVIESNKIYQANTAHTSGVFATDIANWTQLANDVASSTGVLPLANGGTNKNATASAGAVVYSDADSFELTSVGTTGHVLKSNGTSAPSFAAASIKASGQESSQVDAEELDVPNKQLTQIGTNNHLIETGNTNILENPGFEHSTYTTGWTTTGTTATLSAETSTIIHGKKALKAVSSSQNIAIVQDSTLYQASFSGVQGFVKAWISNTAPSVSMCARAAGVTLTGNNCVTLATDGLWKEYVIPVVLSATSNGISIAATSVTGTTIVDEAFVGVVPNAMPEVAQGQYLGSLKYAGTTNCNWSVSSSTFVSFSADADCPAPTVSGVIQAPGTKIPGFVIPQGVELGDLLIIAKGVFGGVAGSFQAFRLTDGTTNSSLFGGYDGGDLNYRGGGTFYLPRTSGSAQTIQFQANATTATAADIRNDVADRQELSFDVWLMPPASKVYSQGCADPRQCENVFSAQVSATGVVSGENLDWISGNCTNASPSVCTFNSGVFSVNPSCNATGAQTESIPQITAISSSSISITRLNTAGSGVNTSFNIVCQKSPPDYKPTNMITGTFANVVTAPGISKPKTCYYFFGGASATLASPTECTTGTCVEVYDSCGTGSPPSVVSTANYENVTFAAGTWAANSPIRCECTGYDTTTGTIRDCLPYFITGDNTWSTDSSGGYITNLFGDSSGGAQATIYAALECTANAP